MKFSIFFLMFFGMQVFQSLAQITQRPRPEEWKQLVPGARFIDRFLPMKGQALSSDTWGVEGVRPRLIDNGIEDHIWSYWGGNILEDKGKYHLFVAGWLEASDKGHAEWPNSYVFNAISDRLEGPYKLRNMIGKGHNPEAFKAKDGRYVLYVIDGRYVADSLNGQWEYGKFDFNTRDRKIIEGLSNLSFTRREDGSFVMVDRGGGIWISEDGLSAYHLLTDKSVYPTVEGEFEDPVIWRDSTQYHLIVNDWLGRIAFYLRSKNGVDWVVDPGEAYAPGIAVHEDGTKEEWYKYERIKIFQDTEGRAIQANFAVIDDEKEKDKPYDEHSSKNISIPLNPGLRLKLINDQPITGKTKTIKVNVRAEGAFQPESEIDLQSLRFGASDEVNYGRGSSVLKSERIDDGLVLEFSVSETGLKKSDFVAKIIGRDKSGNMLYGYTRLPGVDYKPAILSARAPVFQQAGKSWSGQLEVQNFGLSRSDEALLVLEELKGETYRKVASAKVKPLQPYEKLELSLSGKSTDLPGKKLRISIHHPGEAISYFSVDSDLSKQD